MNSESNYDRIHDEYWNTSTTKAGTRYERLVAFVMKSLKKLDVVVHDVRLRGDYGDKHQIDVQIEVSGRQRRILIECKDFDISGNKVGLQLIRGLWGVVDDIHPDESIVITCNGFTRGAQKYAKSRGIKLCILREFKHSDWKGRIRTIHFEINIWEASEPSRVFFHVADQKYITKMAVDLKSIGISDLGIWMGQPVYLNLPDRRMRVTEFVQKVLNDHPRESPGPVELRIRFENTALEVKDLGGVPVEAVEIDFEIVHSNELLELTSDRIARLILEGFGDKDVIIFDDDLRRLNIDRETGEIVS
jgi:hypothetical protein